MLTKRFSLKALLFSLSLMALTIVANTTQAAFTFQIIAANPTNYQLYGTSNTYSVLAFTDSSSTSFTLSAPMLNAVTSDPDVTFTLNFGGGVKALTSLFQVEPKLLIWGQLPQQ
jgi:hypothetical protein